MARSHKRVFGIKRWGSKDARGKAWVMLFKHLWTAAFLLLTLAVLCSPKFAVAGIQKLDENDPRLDESRGEKFVNVIRTVRKNRTTVAVKAPVGYWSQAIFDCKYKDRPIKIQYTGAVILRLPGWNTYYLMGDAVPNTISTEDMSSELEDERWEVTGLIDGSFVTLECPRHDDVLSTKYVGIDNANEDGSIPLPHCQIYDDQELCYVLGLNLKSELAENGWTTDNYVEGHQKIVDKYNKYIALSNKFGFTVQGRKFLSKLKTLLWVLSIILVFFMEGYFMKNWEDGKPQVHWLNFAWMLVAAWLQLKILLYMPTHMGIIANYLGALAFVIGAWYSLRAYYYLMASHPATPAIRKRSVTDAAPLLCTSSKDGLTFMHEHQARKANILCQEVEEETAQMNQKIARLKAELARLGAVHGGAPAEAIAAVQSSRHDAELRRALIRRLAEEEGLHVKE